MRWLTPKIGIIATMVALILCTLSCKKKKDNSDIIRYSDIPSISCGMSYQTSDLFFEEEDTIVFNLRFIYFVDSAGEKEPNYGFIMDNINNFFRKSRIQFKPYEKDFVRLVVDSDVKKDMPSFVKYHFNRYSDDTTLTMYIYGDRQPNYPPDLKNLAGSAGGVGSNFFAVKKRFIYESTVWHELCHCLFLLHTAEPDPTPKGLSLNYGDKVCDLIKSEPAAFSKNDTCLTQCNTGIFTKEEVNTLICNIMSYGYVNCRECLTENQIARMRFYIHESPAMRLAIAEKKELE